MAESPRSTTPTRSVACPRRARLASAATRSGSAPGRRDRQIRVPDSLAEQESTPYTSPIRASTGAELRRQPSPFSLPQEPPRTWRTTRRLPLPCPCTPQLLPAAGGLVVTNNAPSKTARHDRERTAFMDHLQGEEPPGASIFPTRYATRFRPPCKKKMGSTSLVPTLCVGTHVCDALRRHQHLRHDPFTVLERRVGTQSVRLGVPTQSVGPRTYSSLTDEFLRTCFPGLSKPDRSLRSEPVPVKKTDEENCVMDEEDTYQWHIIDLLRNKTLNRCKPRCSQQCSELNPNKVV
jgi:hypothetical protein